VTPADPAARPRWQLALLAAATTALLTLAAAEALLRVAGYRPFFYSTLDRGEPVMNEPDPLRGWRNQPGRYRVPPYAPGGHETLVTILADGSRATSSVPPDARPQLVVVGGSYTLGVGLSDAETWPWKLQSRHPELRVVNLGSGGYGTYQSLLALESYASDAPIAWVLYGFIDHHEVRNVAPPDWIDLLSRFAHRRHVAVPYCTLDAGGALVPHLPLAYPAWPLHEWLASVAFAEHWAFYAHGAQRRDQKRGVTEALIRALAERARARGAGFAVALLSGDRHTLDHYAEFLDREGIDHADCGVLVAPEFQVPGEGHPNDQLTELWTACLDASLGREIRARAAQVGARGAAH
jgi:GNAT superfamily N-acetyltransferase